MKRALQLFFVSIGFFSVFSCSTSKYTYRTGDINKKNIISNSPIVDVKIDLNKKIVQKSSNQPTAENAKSEAYYKAIQNNNIDIIVDPIYEVTKFSNKKYVATITGFAGYYKNPRSKIDVVRELHDIDTLDIKKYNYLFGTQVINTPRKSIAILESGKPNNRTTKKTDNNRNLNNGNSRTPRFIPSDGIEFRAARNFGSFESASFFIETNNGVSVGVGLSKNLKLIKFTKKGKPIRFPIHRKIETGIYYSNNRVSNNIHIPFLITVGNRFTYSLGLGAIFKFRPKDFSDIQSSFFDLPTSEIENIFNNEVPFFNPTFNNEIGYSFNKKVGIKLSTIAFPDRTFSYLSVQSSIGLTYKL